MSGCTQTPFAPAEVIVRMEISCPCCQREYIELSGRIQQDLKAGKVTSHKGGCSRCLAKFIINTTAQNTLEVSQVLDGELHDPSVDCFALLRSSNADGKDPIYFVVATSFKLSVIRAHQVDNDGSANWYFDESTCPTNWLRDTRLEIHNGKVSGVPFAQGIEQVVWAKDPDPHGVFVMVALASYEQVAKVICASPEYEGEPCDKPWEENDELLYLPFAPFMGMAGDTFDGELYKDVPKIT
jgi:hypothetical protein